MVDMNPHPLTSAEWREIMRIPLIRELWGLSEDATPEEFSSLVYAAKFHFFSGSPGYVGEPFILQGDHLTGDPPILLRRDQNGELTSVAYRFWN